MSEELQKGLSRRDLLKSAVSGVAVLGGMAVVTACGGGKSEPEMKKEETPKEEPKKEMTQAEEKPEEMASNDTASDDPCSDLSDVDDDEINKRENVYQYVEKSEKEGQMCSNCQLYNQPKAEGECGGCQLFAGPVQDAGWCVSWAKKS